MEETESNSSHQAIVLTIRPSSGSTFTTAISIESTVLQLKEKLATPDLPVASIRLVYSGRVLKDEDQLSTYCKSFFTLLFSSMSQCHRLVNICFHISTLCNDGCKEEKKGISQPQTPNYPNEKKKNCFCCITPMHQCLNRI